MKPTIKELWFEYQQDKSDGFSEEKRKISQRLCDISEEFVALLNNEQNEKFEEYYDAFMALYSLEEYEAFEKGVLFTARFLTEATD